MRYLLEWESVIQSLQNFLLETSIFVNLKKKIMRQ